MPHALIAGTCRENWPQQKVGCDHLISGGGNITTIC